MRKFELSSVDPRQYEGLTPAEEEAWLHPLSGSYHSFHVERMGANVFRWRDSRTAHFYIGGLMELGMALAEMNMRKVDPDHRTYVTTLNVLSQAEVDDLLSDL